MLKLNLYTMSKKPAFLISFEGIEGTGKSTHVQILSNYLRNKGLSVAVFREPGSSAIGLKIRNILLHDKGKVTNFCEIMLFFAARVQLVAEKIRPNLYKKDVIILDRYIDATAAYQGYGAGGDLELIKRLNQLAVDELIPELTLLLDVSPKLGLRRCGRKDRFEKRKLAFHNRVRNGYLKLAKLNSKRIKVISTRGDIQTIQSRIRDIVCAALAGRRKR